MKKKISRLWVSLVLTAAILLAAADVPTNFFDATGLNKISKSNTAYLEESFTRSVNTFLVLSVIKAGLAVLEGTEIGLGIGIEVGGVVQSVYDYVDLAWRTVLASSVVLLGTRYILQASALVDQWFLSAALFFLLLQFLFRWYLPYQITLKNLLRDIGLVLTLFTLLLYIVLPLSVAGGRLLSKHITARPMHDAETGFSELKENTFSDSEDGKKGIWNKLSGVKDQIVRVVKTVNEKSSEMSVWVLKLIAGYLFDCIVFPLVLFAALFWFSKFLIRYFFDVQKQRTFKEDLESILHRYFSKSDNQQSAS
jgi:hypothetical protein